MQVDIGDAFAAFTYRNDIKKSHTIEVAFFATFAEPIENIMLNPEDHSGYGWFSLEELPNAYPDGKNSEDKEFKIAQKGFALLAGAPPARK
jgi:hypothetical protein